jgi:hypothetical protein
MNILSAVLNIMLAVIALALLAVCTTVWLRAMSRRAMLISESSVITTVRAVIGDWFGFVFAALSLIAFATVCSNIDFTKSLWHQGAFVAIWFACGVIWAAMGMLFLVLANNARSLLLRQFDKVETHRAMSEGLRLAATLPDDDMRRRLYVALSLHLCGAHGANSAVTQVTAPKSWRPVCVPAIVVHRRSGRRRLLRR